MTEPSDAFAAELQRWIDQPGRIRKYIDWGKHRWLGVDGPASSDDLTTWYR